MNILKILLTIVFILLILFGIIFIPYGTGKVITVSAEPGTVKASSPVIPLWLEIWVVGVFVDFLIMGVLFIICCIVWGIYFAGSSLAKFFTNVITVKLSTGVYKVIEVDSELYGFCFKGKIEKIDCLDRKRYVLYNGPDEPGTYTYHISPNEDCNVLWYEWQVEKIGNSGVS